MSAVPGRLRFHCRDLLGRRGLCRHVEQRLATLDHVVDARANHRTGRVLVVHHLDGIETEAFLSAIRHAIAERKHAVVPAAAMRAAHRAAPGEPSSSLSGRGLAREAALLGLKSLLPTPWNALLPMAVQFVRRQA